MQNEVILSVLPALAGMFFLGWISIYCRRMQSMGEDLSSRVVRNILGEEATPEEVNEEISHLRGRLLAAGVAFLCGAAVSLAACLLLAWRLETSLYPLVLAGVSALAICLALGAFVLRGSITTP